MPNKWNNDKMSQICATFGPKHLKPFLCYRLSHKRISWNLWMENKFTFILILEVITGHSLIEWTLVVDMCCFTNAHQCLTFLHNRNEL